MNPTPKIFAASLNQVSLDWKGNSTRIKQSISAARDKGADVLVLPELCITGYGCEDMFLAPWVAQKAKDQLEILIEDTAGMWVNFGLPVLFEGSLYNCCCVVYDGKIQGITAKQFLANDGVHYEHRWFTPWPSSKKVSVSFLNQEIAFGDLTYDFQSIKIAYEICEDAWRENRPAHRFKKEKVTHIFNPSASHFAFGKSQQREDLVLSSSKEFDCTYVYINLLGNETGRMIFDGETLVASNGELHYRGTLFSYKEIVLHDLSEGHIEPQLTKEEEFPGALCLGLFDYLRKSFTKGFVLSLSGGADSATCAVMVAEMFKRSCDELGIEGAKTQLRLEGNTAEEVMKSLLTTAYQSTTNSSKTTFNAAESLAKELGATFYHWAVDAPINDYISNIENQLGRKLSWTQDDIALQNIQARSRSPIIWMLANITGGLLLTTSNRSEADVGYATMDGDTSGSLAPIAAVDKHFIRKWLIWAEMNLGYKSLGLVNEQQPTAELRPTEQSQTDEEDLMPYDIMAKIEREFVLKGRSPQEILDKIDPNLPNQRAELIGMIKRFFTLWSRNQWKRERTAPAFHLDDFNVDPKTWFRHPILSSGFLEEIDSLR